jgi:hypothetical protein
MRTTVIVDIDHTISDAAWRDPLIGNWDEYYPEGLWDRPIEFVMDLVRLVSAAREVVAVTARPEAVRWLTVSWMIRHKVPIDTILMRPADDYRPSWEVKTDLVRNNFPDLGEIDFVLEDRDDCVAAYRKLGLNVLQVNYNGGRRDQADQDGKDGDGQREDAQLGGGPDKAPG